MAGDGGEVPRQKTNKNKAMRTTQKERYEVLSRLERLGVDYQTANALRRISNTLRNWFEMECGTENAAGASISIERDENDKPFIRHQYQSQSFGWIDNKRPIADREAGAKKRLAALMQPYKRRLVPYIQGDCRGAALYILRKSDVKGQNVDQVYTRGVAVY